MAVKVRRATREDARTIAEFALKLVEQHRAYDPTRFATLGSPEGMARFYGSQTEADDAAILVAELGERVVGFVYVTYAETDYLDLAVNAAQIQDIYVDETARGNTAGRRLIEAAIQAAKEFGATKLLLSVAARNTIAQEFFQHHGFRTTMLEMMLELPG